VIKSTLPALRRPGAPEDVREAADDIDREVARLDRIVGDVLDYTREMRLDFGAVDLSDVCRDAAAAALAGEARVTWTLEIDAGLPPVVTDAERLRGVLVTLLTNAREAVLGARGSVPVRQRGGPEIELRAGDAGEGRVRLEVRDRGPGIPEDALPHVFEPYFTTKRTGTGLGLAIARNVAEALGGALSAHNRPEGGASLRLELPLTPPARR
jgi:signal transduction histidine kinase